MTTARLSRAADEDAYLDLVTLAHVGGLSVRTLRDRIHDPVDPLPAYRVGGKLLVRRSEFDTWMSRRRYTATTVDGVVEDVLRELVRPSA
jgi:excisionase family DNA binding protein